MAENERMKRHERGDIDGLRQDISSELKLILQKAKSLMTSLWKDTDTAAEGCMGMLSLQWNARLAYQLREELAALNGCNEGVYCEIIRRRQCHGSGY